MKQRRGYRRNWADLLMLMLGFFGPMCVAFLVPSFPVAGHDFRTWGELDLRSVLQSTEGFWSYDRASNSWNPVDITHLLLESGGGVRAEEEVEGKVGQKSNSKGESKVHGEQEDGRELANESSSSGRYRSGLFLFNSATVSMAKFLETSLWMVGQSGSIFERYWNGIQWVYIPHDLPNVAGKAEAVMAINRTVVATSRAGILYQLQMQDRQLVWKQCSPYLPGGFGNVSDVVTLQGAGKLSNDGSRLYFAASDGSLLELISISPPLKWAYHRKPSVSDGIAAIVDAGGLRQQSVFVVSMRGDLFEFDSSSKTPWRNHTRVGSPIENFPLAPCPGVLIKDLWTLESTSLFLLTKEGMLVERFNRGSAWRWLLHKAPADMKISRSLGVVLPSDQNDGKGPSLFLSSEQGAIWEYSPLKSRVGSLGKQQSAGGAVAAAWLKHGSPGDDSVMPDVPGVLLSPWRMFFPLRDGRLGELHLQGTGGMLTGPTYAASQNQPASRRPTGNYTWTIIEVPETEGGNAEYCSSSAGPANCLEGTHQWGERGWSNRGGGSDQGGSGGSSSPSMRRRGWGSKHHESGGSKRAGAGNGGGDENEDVDGDAAVPSVNTRASMAAPVMGGMAGVFKMRLIQHDTSMFLVMDDGVVAERYFNGESWVWINHENSSPIAALTAVYNGSVLGFDKSGCIQLRERHGSNLRWHNVSSEDARMPRITSGAPLDDIPGKPRPVTTDDAIFFVDENGELLELLVALRLLSWRNCGKPAGVPIAAILDAEVLRLRVVFVVGTDGLLYEYNRVTEQWKQHKQPSHIRLSPLPAAVMRPSLQSMIGSLFMRAEDGGMVGFIDDQSVFVIGTDGHIYERLRHGKSWQWIDHNYPGEGSLDGEQERQQLERSKGFGEDEGDAKDGTGLDKRTCSIGTSKATSDRGDGKNIDLVNDDNTASRVEEHGHCSFPEQEGQREEPDGTGCRDAELLDAKDPDTHASSPTYRGKSSPMEAKFVWNKEGLTILNYGNCNPEVAPVRAMAMSERVIVFYLKDKRLAEWEMHGEGGGSGSWAVIASTPESNCFDAQLDAAEVMEMGIGMGE
ncbi:hypothetical protein CBR_g12234 [Chara braunii]|uniref:Uncharacterized protein n=1 Tax=Chara braunii TaxID=69332 RepID=A0A388KRL8_CHABU|nr:hypothetical protein CBR_g12234 [Chara braunii]|eukprot:GBG72662.1 hypothetical protein CBR_g12234 [Chara braunii]